MGLDFGRKDVASPSPSGRMGEQSGFQDEIQPVKQYDIVADRQKMQQELVNSQEIDELVSTINVYDMDTVVTFGSKAADEVSKVSDAVLRSMDMSQLDGSSEMLKTLAAIMAKFDIEEIKDRPASLFSRFFGNIKKQLEDILAKYHTMGGEVDKIYVQLKGYESEIKQSNKKLNAMFDANVGYYHELVKYILAGDQASNEIAQYIQKREDEYARTGDDQIKFEITQLSHTRDMLDQRIQDLRTVESVAMQSIPMLKTMEFTNYNLVRKINSAFIVTLPVFKQALAQAVLLKRQKIQAESLSELDKKTNELLVRNAKNSVEISTNAARLSSGSSIKIETLEQTWRTITKGIDETRSLQEQARAKRLDDQKRLEELKADFNRRFHISAAAR